MSAGKGINIEDISIDELLRLYSGALDFESAFLASGLCMHAAAAELAQVRCAEQRENASR